MNQLSSDHPVQGPPAPAGSPSARTQTTQAQETQAQDTQVKGTQVKNTQPNQPPRLSAAVLAQIGSALRQGSEAEPQLATQADLVALHKRIGEMFTTLNEGLGAQHSQKAAADRAALSARIDQLEEAVNRMEGALRIEFEPVLKAALAETLAQSAPPRRRRWRGALAALALAVAALVAGVVWQAPLMDMATPALSWISAQTQALLTGI